VEQWELGCGGDLSAPWLKRWCRGGGSLAFTICQNALPGEAFGTYLQLVIVFCPYLSHIRWEYPLR